MSSIFDGISIDRLALLVAEGVISDKYKAQALAVINAFYTEGVDFDYEAIATTQEPFSLNSEDINFLNGLLGTNYGVARYIRDEEDRALRGEDPPSVTSPILIESDSPSSQEVMWDDNWFSEVTPLPELQDPSTSKGTVRVDYIGSLGAPSTSKRPGPGMYGGGGRRRWLGFTQRGII